MRTFTTLLKAGLLAVLLVLAIAPPGSHATEAPSAGRAEVEPQASLADVAPPAYRQRGKVCYGVQLRRCTYLTITNGYVVGWGAFSDRPGGSNYRTTVTGIDTQVWDDNVEKWVSSRREVWATSDTALHVQGKGWQVGSQCGYFRAVATFIWSGTSSGIRNLATGPVFLCR